MWAGKGAGALTHQTTVPRPASGHGCCCGSMGPSHHGSVCMSLTHRISGQDQDGFPRSPTPLGLPRRAPSTSPPRSQSEPRLPWRELWPGSGVCQGPHPSPSSSPQFPGRQEGPGPSPACLPHSLPTGQDPGGVQPQSPPRPLSPPSLGLSPWKNLPLSGVVEITFPSSAPNSSQ